MPVEAKPVPGNPARPFAGIARARLLASCLLLAAVLLVTGCAAPQRVPEHLPRPVQLAQQAESRSDWRAAAGFWEQAASEAKPAEASEYHLRAAEAWFQLPLPGRANEQLERVNSSLLDRVAATRYALLGAELAIEAGDEQRAEFFLDAARPQAGSKLWPRYRAAQSSLEALRTDPYAQALSRASSMISELGAFDGQRGVGILQSLEGVPSSRLAQVAAQANRLGQWAAVTLAVRQALVGDEDLLSAAGRWATEHPDLEIDGPRFMDLCWQYGLLFQAPARVAVLLPEDGSLAFAGSAIRDGILSAYLDRRGQAQTELTFLPAPEDPTAALQAYRDAADDGYQWIIGPLSRESVQSVVDGGGSQIPALVLNQFTPPASGGSYVGLSLAQGAEARAVARKMLAVGVHRVILMIDDSDWGNRAQTAFSDEYAAGGGEVVATGSFDTAEPDHSERLAALLKIEDSRQRKDRLQAALRIPLDFEPTRRDDFDCIFMAAGPSLARQLKPQLKFFDAGDEPVFAMSRVFSGRIDPAADLDLNGIVFPATRWALARKGEFPDLESLKSGTFGSLFALGTDAWNVLPWLPLLKKDPDLQFAGATGRLRLQASGELTRDPLWAWFVDGRPRPYAQPSQP